MYIQLNPEQEKFIQKKNASGEYINANDIISEALKLLESQETKLQELKVKIKV